MLAYLGAADDVALKQASPALCPSAGRAGQSRSSLQPHWDPIAQPTARPQIPGQHRWEAVTLLGRDGARSPRAAGDQEQVNFALGVRKASKQNCYRRETEQLPDPRAAALPDVKKGKKMSFPWVSCKAEAGFLPA